MAANEDSKNDGKSESKSKDASRKKEKAAPKKERQISLRLSAKGARRLNRLTELKEWTVTQVVEEALKAYALQEGVSGDDRGDDKPDAKKNDEKRSEEKRGEVKRTEETREAA